MEEKLKWNGKELLDLQEQKIIKQVLPKTTGVYKILNLVNNKVYIGSTNARNGFASRWYRHILALKNNESNKHLQNAWNLYGAENFSFEIIEIIPRNSKEKKDPYIREREQYYINLYKSYNKNCGYNINKKANGGGNSYTLEDIKEGRSVLSYALLCKLIEELKKEDKSERQLEKEYGVSRCTIKKIRKGEFIPELTKGIKPRRMTRTQVLQKDKKDIVKKYQEGSFIKDLAEEYQVSRDVIFRVLFSKPNLGKAIPVYQYNLKGELLNKFYSISEAQRRTGVDNPAIQLATLQYGKEAGGFLWSIDPLPPPTKIEQIIGHRMTKQSGMPIIKYNTNEEIICCYDNFRIMQEHEKDISARHLVEKSNKVGLCEHKNSPFLWCVINKAPEKDLNFLIQNKDLVIKE